MKVQGLHVRLALTVALGAMVLALLSSFYAYERAFQHSLQNSERSVRQLMATVEVSAAIATYVNNAEIGNDVIRGLLNNDMVSGARLHNHAGFSVQSGKPLSTGGPSYSQKLLSPIDGKEPVGEIIVVPNQSLIENNARTEAIATVTQLIMQTALVATLVLIAVYLMLTRPLTQLSLDLHRIVPGSGQRLAFMRGHKSNEIGKLTGDINALLDTVSQILEQERQLRERIEILEQRFRGIFEDSSAGIFLLQPDGRLTTANPAFMQAVGQSDMQGLMARHAQFIESLFVDAEQFRALIAAAINTGRPSATDVRFRRYDNAQLRWAHCVLSANGDDEATATIEGVLYDITERKQLEEMTRALAEVDTLTDLFNRHYLEQVLEQMTSTAGNPPFALLLCDLDRFKDINDGYGHEAGDTVLKTVAERLRAVVRDQDVVGRLGGDEFLILLHKMGTAAPVHRIAAKLIESIAAPITITATVSDQVGISIGIAFFPRHGSTAHDLRKHADAAMYAVKRAGRNGYAIWHKQQIEVTQVALDSRLTR